MVEIADITDEDSLKAWLENQPRVVAVWIASRAAARVLPISWQAILTENPEHQHDSPALPILRNVFIASVATFVAHDGILSAAKASSPLSAPDPFAPDQWEIVWLDVPEDTSAKAVTEGEDSKDAGASSITEDGPGKNRSEDAVAAARAAVHTAGADLMDKRLNPNIFAAHSVALSAAVTNADIWKNVLTDARYCSEGAKLGSIPLWPMGTHPFENEWNGIRRHIELQSDAADWRFWLDWYDAQLSGRTMLPDAARTWDMLEQIALIDPEIWDAGPETVNPVIREIWELHRLRAECAALQAEKDAFLAARASQTQRSHNQPPDGLVDDHPEVAQQITIVWDSLDEARDELDHDTPDKGVLRRIAEKLFSALTAIARYCGKVADTAIMSAAEGAGKEAGKLGVHAAGITVLDQVLNNGRLTQFAKDLLTYASGG